jgi:hypothetical protein
VEALPEKGGHGSSMAPIQSAAKGARTSAAVAAVLAVAIAAAAVAAMIGPHHCRQGDPAVTFGPAKSGSGRGSPTGA